MNYTDGKYIYYVAMYGKRCGEFFTIPQYAIFKDEIDFTRKDKPKQKEHKITFLTSSMCEAQDYLDRLARKKKWEAVS